MTQSSGLILSQKFKAFLRYGDAKFEFLEGETAAGKTTVGVIKFIYKCLISPKRQHFIAALDLGTISKNIVNKELGLLDFFGEDISYYPDGGKGEKMPHLRVRCSGADKIVYLLGYADVQRWKKALGGQYGCGYIDEINIADIDFVRESTMRCDYVMATLNPDDPNLEVYSDYINHSRPLPQYWHDAPEELMIQLQSQPAKDKWVHWFFKMDDNAALNEEKKQQIRGSVPIGSKLYKNKIAGLRGRSEGLVYDCFNRDVHVVNTDVVDSNFLNKLFLPGENVFRIVFGLDSGINQDATGVTTQLLTTAGRVIIIPSFYFDIPKRHNPLNNSSVNQAKLIERWLDFWLVKFECYDINISIGTGDSAAITQALMLELNQWTKYKFTAVGKKDILADTQRVYGLFAKQGYAVIVNAGYIDVETMEKKSDTDMLIVELENLVWDKKKNQPMDGNDHLIDSLKYGTFITHFGGGY